MADLSFLDEKRVCDHCGLETETGNLFDCTEWNLGWLCHDCWYGHSCPLCDWARIVKIDGVEQECPRCNAVGVIFDGTITCKACEGD